MGIIHSKPKHLYKKLSIDDNININCILNEPIICYDENNKNITIKLNADVKINDKTYYIIKKHIFKEY